jgi:hypothetical protein
MPDISYSELIKKISQFTGVNPTARLVLISLLPHVIRINEKDQLVVPIIAKTMARKLGMTPKNFSNVMTDWEEVGVVERYLQPNQVIYMIDVKELDRSKEPVQVE